MIVVAPTPARICRMDLRTASMKAGGVLHKMLTIGNLDCAGLRGQSATAAAIPTNKSNVWLTRQPGLCRRWLTIRQQGGGLAAMEIANRCPVSGLETALRAGPAA